jgi:hypothetical protein
MTTPFQPTWRPKDVAYRAKLEEQESAEMAMGQQEKSPDSQEALLSVFQSFTKVLKDNNQHLQSSDVTEPTKFNGLDTQWDDFYLQLRTYLEAKGWLTTFDHKDGPGTAGFNTEINKKIYNKLLALCRKVQQPLTLRKQLPLTDGQQEDT